MSLVYLVSVPRRTYHQPECGLAVALDLLGERWTLLLIRELLMGPHRYSDLLDALDGISTNLLAERLRHLETIGIAERAELPPPAASMVYQLTEAGRSLEPIVIELAKWGHKFTSPGECFDPRATIFAMRTHFHGHAEPTTGLVHVHVENHTISVGIETGHLVALPHAVGLAAAAITIGAETLRQTLCGMLTIAEAARSGQASIDGDANAAVRLFEAMSHD